MKTIHIGSILLIALLGSAFFISTNALSEYPTDTQATSSTHTVSVEANHPLAMAHQELKNAYDHFGKKELEAVHKDLKAANQWLQNNAVSKNAKTKEEAAILIKEIELFQQRIDQPAEEKEGAIARLYHRGTALVQREAQHALKNWDKASATNATLRQLIDAKLHFHYAEHELFVSHDIEDANEELSKTIEYLDRANETALPAVKQKIVVIKKEVQELATNHTTPNIVEQQKIIQALDTAHTALQQASKGVTATEIQNRLSTITNTITRLKKDIGTLENKQYYDSIMDKINKVADFH